MIEFSYYFVNTYANDQAIQDLQAALDADFTPEYWVVPNFYNWEEPRANYIRTIGIQYAPTFVSIDESDDTVLVESNDPDAIAGFQAATEAAYAAKHPA